jgi:hypothetical protein
MSWTPASRKEVESILQTALDRLVPTQRERFERIQVQTRPVPVATCPGERVWVVAENYGRVIYWSDIEEGWEIVRLNKSGGIDSRGSNQFDLSHLMYQLFEEG